MPDLHPYLVSVGLKLILSLSHLFVGEYLLEVDIANITVLISEYCLFLVSLLGIYYLHMVYETCSG